MSGGFFNIWATREALKTYLLLFSHSVVFDSFRPRGLWHPGLPVLHYLLEFVQTHVDWVGDAIKPSCPLLPSIFPSIGVFSNVSPLCIRWPKYWGFSLSVSPSNEYSGLISFRIDWFDLLAIQRILKIFSSITIWKHQFFSTQHNYWKNHSFDYMDLFWETVVSAF